MDMAAKGQHEYRYSNKAGCGLIHGCIGAGSASDGGSRGGGDGDGSAGSVSGDTGGGTTTVLAIAVAAEGRVSANGWCHR